MRGWVSWVVACTLAFTGCVHSDTIECGDHVCPPHSRCGPADECVSDACGDGVVQAGEQCDGSPSGDCTDLGYYLPDGLACTTTCSFDTALCSERCGDHITNGPETCDGFPPAGRTCTSFGFDLGPIGCAEGCAPDLRNCGMLGWSAQPGEGTGTLNAIWGSDPEHVFAVGTGGSIMQRVHGVWTPMTSGTTLDLDGVWGTSPTDVYAVGMMGTILHYDGMSWSPMPSPTGANLRAIDGAGSSVFAVGNNDTILELIGGSWVKATVSPPQSLPFNAVSAEAQLAVGGTGRVFQRTGNSWTQVPDVPAVTEDLLSISALGSTRLIGGSSGRVLWYDGTTWTATAVPVWPPLIVRAELSTARIVRPGEAYLAGSAGIVFRFDGTQFVAVPLAAPRTCHGLFSFSPHDVILAVGGIVYGYTGTITREPTIDPSSAPLTLLAVGHARSLALAGSVGGTVYARTDGNTWQPLGNIVTNAAVQAIWSEGDHVAVGTSSQLLYSQTGATGTFTPATGLSPDTYGITGISGHTGDLYASGNGQIWHTTDPTGATWTPEVSNGVQYNAIWATTGFAIAVADAGGIATRDSTGTWTQSNAGTTEHLFGVWGSSPTSIHAVGTGGTLLHFDGATWRPIALQTSEVLRGIDGTSSADIFVVSSSGRIFHFDGTSWSPLLVSPTASYKLFSVDATPTDVLFGGDIGRGQELLRTCLATEQRCDDASDDDCDGLINCADPDCNDTLTCNAGGACAPAAPLACNVDTPASTYSGIARIDDLACLDVSTRGTETSFRFTADASGATTLTLTDPSGSLRLALAPSLHAACDLSQCTAAPPIEGGRELTFTATAGETYYVVVDGPYGSASDFTLRRSCP